MGGEYFGFLMEKLLQKGALDVWYTPIFMKKNRPAIKVSVLCTLEKEEMLSGVLLQETTTLGVRSYSVNRRILQREFIRVQTPYGEITIKTASGDGVHKGAPEYEDCKRAALQWGVPLREVYDTAVKAYREMYSK